MPKITVIITTYKRPELVKDAVKSVLAQTFTDFELIVVEDASSDGTEEVVRSFNDERISYICHEVNKGDAAAKNTGIKRAKGKYIITLDDDDLFAPKALHELVSKIEKSPENVCGVYGWSWWVAGRGKTLKVLAPKQEATFHGILSKQFFTNILLKREVFESIGFYDESLKSSYDHDFYLRLAQKYKFEFVPQILFIIRLQEKHLSNISIDHMKRYEEVTRRFAPMAKKKGVFLLKFIPPGLYVRLSVLRHRVVTFLRFVANLGLKKQVLGIKEALTRENINL